MLKSKQALKSLFYALPLCLLALSFSAYAVDQQKPEKSMVPCGPNCKCGCAQGGPCTCAKKSARPLGPCGPDCTCGCVEGRPCTCKEPKVGVVQPEGPCGPDCTCGCVQGGPCTCKEPKLSYGFPEFAQPSKPCDMDYEVGCVQGCDSPCPAIGPNLNDGCADARGCDCDCHQRVIPHHVDPPLYPYEGCCQGGIWLPDDPVLFRPFMADPREVDYSVGWRFNDNAMTKNIIAVSFGDSFPIYRWCDVWPWHGVLQLELEGAVYATFDPCTFSAPLMNADYYVGFPLSYAIDRWQFRLRGYHISCHIGDEFLLNHPGFDRRNDSSEYVDFFISHDLTEEIRLYAGIGYILRQDEEFHASPFFSAIGAELRLLRLGFLDCKDMLYGCPIYAMHFRQSGDYRHHIDSTFILGYEFGKLCGLYRKLRFFLEYHDGYSVEGQRSKIPTNYFSIRGSYGF